MDLKTWSKTFSLHQPLSSGTACNHQLQVLSACSVFDSHLPSPVTACTSVFLPLGFTLRALSLALSFLPALHAWTSALDFSVLAWSFAPLPVPQSASLVCHVYSRWAGDAVHSACRSVVLQVLSASAWV